MLKIERPGLPEAYGRTQLGLNSSFFMKRNWPLSRRQYRFLSPRTKMEEEEWEKEGTERSRACSPRTNAQSGWRRTHMLGHYPH